MRYETSVRFIRFILSVLLGDPTVYSYDASMRLLQMQHDAMELETMIAPPNPENDTYKMYSLSCSFVLLDEFFLSVPLHDTTLRSRIIAVRRELVEIENLGVQHKRLEDADNAMGR